MRRVSRGVGPRYPQVVILVGATGDLSRRKLLPGLFHLVCGGFIPGCRVIGLSLDDLDRDRFRAFAREALGEFSTRAIDNEDWCAFAEMLDFVPLKAGAAALKAAVEAAELALGPETQRVHYMSVPPSAALSTVQLLEEAGLVEGSRIIMEKPFGTDLQSAVFLNAKLHEVFAEDQIFRIDHFLGKEPAQNILAFRFANGLFEPIWNRNFIDHVQIDVPETLGLGKRIAFYETDRRVPRHGGDAPVPDPRLHGDGAADRAGTGADQRGEEQGLPQHAADRPAQRRARAIYRLPVRGGRGPGIGHRNLHRAEMSRSTIGAGPGCRSSCARASGWPRGSASSRSPSASRRRVCSRPARASARRDRTT